MLSFPVLLIYSSLFDAQCLRIAPTRHDDIYCSLLAQFLCSAPAEHDDMVEGLLMEQRLRSRIEVSSHLT